MKIAVVISKHIPSEWAHSINTVKHADAFYRLGHSVTILSPVCYFENKKLSEIHSVYEYYDISPQIELRFFRDTLNYFGEFKFIRSIAYIIKRLTRNIVSYLYDSEREIASYIKENQFSFAYCRSYRTPYYLILNKVPVIVEVHSPKIKDIDLRRLLSLSESKYFLGISTISEKLKKKFVDYGFPREKIIVQEDAVDLKKFTNIKHSKRDLRKIIKLPIGKKIITYCGSLHEDKGILDIIKTAKRIQSNKSVLFVLVGGPESLRRKWLRMCSKENVHNILFRGFVSQKLVPIYLKSSDILIMPYNLNYRKGVMDLNTTSPIKLFEYMAAKVPIISSNIPTIRKVVTHNVEALLAEPGNIRQLSQYISGLINNEKLYKKLVVDAYKKVKSHTYKVRCTKLLSFVGKELKNDKGFR